MSKTVLIIDDSPDFRETLSDILNDYDFDVFEAGSPKDGFEILFQEKVDVILCDLNMPFTEGEDKDSFVSGEKVGVHTIKELGFAFPEMPIICISGEDSFVLTKASKELGDIPVLRKPVPYKTLIVEIEKACNAPLNQLKSNDELITH